jgi:hypothetical protein
MPRITRSTKITIAEDESSLSTPRDQQVPTIEARAPLEEINNNVTEEIVSLEEAQIADQEKLLKAAFKTAIGIKKKSKKAKNKRNAKQQHSSSEEVVLDDQPAPLSPAAAEARQLLQSDPGSLMHLLDGLQGVHLAEPKQGPMANDIANAPSAAVRLTRSQMRNMTTPKGQYNHYSYGAYSSGPAIPVPQIPDYRSGFQPGHISFGDAVNSPSFGRSVQSWISNDYNIPRSPFTNRDWRTAEQEPTYVYNGPQPPETVDRDGDIGIEHALQSGDAVLDSIQQTERDESTTPEPQSSHEDSFVEHIVERSPAKPVLRRYSIEELVELRSACKPESRIEDSVDELDKFEQIIIRSPAKPLSRIEDSVEELDKMEEALEALSEAARAQELVSPMKSRKTAPISSAARTTGTKAKTIGAREGRALMREMAANKAASGTSTVRIRPTEVRKTVSTSTLRRSASVEPKAAPAVSKRPIDVRPVSFIQPKAPVKSTKPPTRPSFELPGEAIARQLKEKREAREARMAARQLSVASETALLAAKAMAPKVKSTKPVTKPTFELPGEALSRRKREAQEARLKAQEEEERKRREFRAKPLPKSIVPSVVPRETVASLARKSIIGFPDAQGTTGDLPVAKRSSIVGVHRPSSTQANVSAPRTRVSSQPGIRKTPVTTSGPSMSGLSMQRSSSRSSTQTQKQKGKEVYRRDARAQEEAERERREKEAAAKKAREEAAERGRQASREWAEKQRRRMMEGRMPDEGLSAGYGPGGQMGLRA